MDQATFKKFKYLIEPCQSVEELNSYIIDHWNIVLPWDIVDEKSTSSSLKFMWSIYKAMLYGSDIDKHVLAASRNSAKCLAEGTLVATPTGPVEIQNIKPGDYVLDEFGKPIKVVAVFDQGEQDCVGLWQGRSKLAVCTLNHIWLMSEARHPDKWEPRNLLKHSNSYGIKRLELSTETGTKNEPLAYALGALLGDGCSTECGVRMSSKDDTIPSKVARLLGTTFLKLRSNNYSYLFHAPKRGAKWVFSDFYEKCIRNKRSYEKTADINEIKTWNRQSLLAFVAGVLDTDGSVFFRQNQIYIQIGMQAKEVIEAIQYAFVALWQVHLPIITDNRLHYVNGPLYKVEINSVYHCKRILKELDPHLVVLSKKYKSEYDSLKPNNFNPNRCGVKVRAEGRVRCWDITVDSPTSLYCLQNGLVTHNTLTSSMIQYFSMLHFRRDGVQIAALLDQSAQAITYLNNFTNNELLAPYTKTDNIRKKRFVGLPANDYTTRAHARLQVVTASKKGANSPRASCLAGDSLVSIRTPEGWVKEVPIKTIVENHKHCPFVVVSVNPITLNIEYSRVMAAKKSKNPDRVKITTKLGCSLESTPDHYHAINFCASGVLYEQAGNLEKIQDSLMVGFGSRLSKITDIQRFQSTDDEYVYDITVENNHNFFANQILTHNCLTLDEIDLTPPEVLSEAAYIADPAIRYKPDGTTETRNPIYIYLSSRKSNSGPIQDLLDEGEGLQGKEKSDSVSIHKWSSVDWMKKCTDDISRKEEGSFPVFINTETLNTIWSQEQFEHTVENKNKHLYIERQAYEGCRKCSAWVACQGRSTKQRSTSYMLRDRKFIGGLLSSVKSAPAIIAQTLNWKPESTGIVFKSFSVSEHYRPPREVYRWITGKDFKVSDADYLSLENGENYKELIEVIPTKKDIYNAMLDNEWNIVSGIDWGYDPDPAVIVVGGYHKKLRKCIVLDIHAENGHPNHLWAEYACKSVFSQFPVQYVNPDMADPSCVTYFKPYGVRCFGRKPPKIETGVSFIRGLLWNPINQTSGFMILDDGMTDARNRFMLEELTTYTHHKDALGRFDMDKFEDKNNHSIDALRYMLHPFTMQNSIVTSASLPDLNFQNQNADNNKQPAEIKSQMADYFSENFGVDPFKESDNINKDGKSNVKKTSSIKFII